jgi:aryl-alcohol dehydrogenase-like predicted oxidoreductase
MKYNQLGKTDIKVSHVCLGTMTWGCQNSENDAHDQMDYAVEHGINFFDTAELYAVPPEEHTQGLTEQYIGNWFEKTGKRDDIILASKATGKMMGNGIPWIRNSEGLNRKNLQDAIDGSLKRLKTDYIDLYQLHAPNRPYPHHGKHCANKIDFTKTDGAAETDMFLEILETLNEFKQAGKIRAFGLSNDTTWGIMKYLELSKTHNLPRISSIQNEYSLMYQHDDPYVVEACVHENVAYLPWSPLAAGSLSGKYLNGARPEGTRWKYENAMGRPNQRDTDTAADAIRAYINIADKYGLDICQMALAWCYQKEFVTSTIIGATSMDQLKSNIAAKDITLSEDCLNDLIGVYQQYPVPF